METIYFILIVIFSYLILDEIKNFIPDIINGFIRYRKINKLKNWDNKSIFEKQQSIKDTFHESQIILKKLEELHSNEILKLERN